MRRVADEEAKEHSLGKCLRTFPVPPSPTRTSLKVGVSAIVCVVVGVNERLVGVGEGRLEKSVRKRQLGRKSKLCCTNHANDKSEVVTW